MRRFAFNVIMVLFVAAVFSLAGCGGGGSTTTPPSTPVAAIPDPTAPSTPTGLTATQVNSDSVTLNWNASSGGNGGVYSYKVFSNGQQVGGTTLVNSTTPVLTTCTVTSLQPSTSYNFTIASTSLAGTSSVQSPAITATTASAASIVSKLLPHPYIVFDTRTGKIWSQCYISPGIIAKVTLSSSYDVIAHQRVDATLYKITTQANRKYAVSDINTGVPIEPSIDAPPLLGLGSSSGPMQNINMISGALTSTVSAGSTFDLILNINDGGGAYLVGEAL
jgi:predicted small lipoprotein YifL